MIALCGEMHRSSTEDAEAKGFVEALCCHMCSLVLFCS